MGYPVAYRRGAAGSGGSGARGFQPYPDAPLAPPPYTNPGWRQPPKSANDNFRRLSRVVRGVGRLLPILRAVDIAIEAYEWANYLQPSRWHFPHPWYLHIDCKPPSMYEYDDWARLQVNSCLTSQATGDRIGRTPADVMVEDPDTVFMTWFRKYQQVNPPHAWRSAVRQNWRRPAISPANPRRYPWWGPGTYPLPEAPHEVPWSPPALEPEVPPMRPEPHPQPIPYPDIPYRPAPELPHAPDRGYAPGRPQHGRPRPGPSTGGLPVIDGRPSPAPQPSPNPPVDYIPDAPAFPRVPPGPRTKERKIMSSHPGYSSLLKWARRYETLKDARDVIRAVHDALPKSAQTKSRRLQDLLMAIYRGAAQLDTSKAIQGVMRELAEDRAGGQLDKLRSAAAKRLGVSKQQIRTYQGL